MDKFKRALQAMKEARAKAVEDYKRQEKANKELVRKWRELTNRHVASYSRSRYLRSPGLA